MKKIRVGIVAGGQSSEHEISCVSAGGVLAAIDRDRFEPVLIGITKSGKWVLPASDTELQIRGTVLPEIPESAPLLCADLNGFSDHASLLNLDVIFPVLHGPYGEDGTFQGACEIAGLRYVGSGVLASAAAMDKSFAKAIFAAAGLNVARGLVVHQRDWSTHQKDIIADIHNLGFPVFVKPARGGSSRGTFKVKDSSDLITAITEALTFDSKVLVEEAIVGREIECGVLQVAGVVRVSQPGEVLIAPKYDFYDFHAKYLDGATRFVTNVELPGNLATQIAEQAHSAFNALGCEGLARVDFFLSDDQKIIINEINTMPGFTSTSVFPQMWQAMGIEYSALISILLDSALSRSTSVTR